MNSEEKADPTLFEKELDYGVYVLSIEVFLTYILIIKEWIYLSFVISELDKWNMVRLTRDDDEVDKY